MDKFDIEVRELARNSGYGYRFKQIYRIYSKLNSHPTIDKLGNPIDKDHWKVHTK